MLNKITDTRIEELQRLKALKDEMSRKIQRQSDEMQALLDSMDKQARELASASPKVVKDARGKASPSFSLGHQDAIDALELTIRRLEEDHAAMERELEELEEEEVVNST